MTLLTAYPELLRLAALLLLDPPKTRRILAADDVAQYGVDPSGPAGRLLGDLVMAAPDGPDAAHDTLTRGALAHGLRLLADAGQAEVDNLAGLATDWKRYLEIRTLLQRALDADKPALVTEALALGRLHNFDPGLIGGTQQRLGEADADHQWCRDFYERIEGDRPRIGSDISGRAFVIEDVDQPSTAELGAVKRQKATKDLVELLAGAAHTAAVEWIRGEPSGVRLMTGDGEAHGVRGLAAAYELKLGGVITAAVSAALLSVKDRVIANKIAAEIIDPPAPAAERDEDGYALCTSCRRERAAGRSAVQGCSDCLWLNEGEQERVTAEVIPLTAPAGCLADLDMEAMTAAALQGFALPPEMFGERGPVKQGRTVFNAEEYVAHFGTPAPGETGEPHFLTLMGRARIPTPAEEAEFMRCATGGHTIEISPNSDPEVCAALGLQHPDPVGAVVELIKRAAGDGPPVADVAAAHEADRIMRTLTAEQKAEVQRRLTARDPFDGWTFTPEHRAARERLGLSVPCAHSVRESGKRVPAGAGNRPTEVCSTCGAWRVMGPGEPWHLASEPFPEGSV